MKWILLALLVSIVLLTACGAPASKPATSPTPIPEPAIPTHFVTYTDESGLFSISYPPDWELALTETEGITQDVEDYLADIGSEGSLTETNVVFFAGIPYGTGYNPNVSVFISPSEGTTELEEVVEAVVQHGYMKDTEEYHEFSRTKTVVDGREAIILDCEAKYPLVDKVRALQLMMYTHDSKLGWSITCSVMQPKDFSDFEDDFHALVRSIRILK